MRTHPSAFAAPFLVVGVGLLLAGCATIVSGKHQGVSITSTPSGAQVSIHRAAGSEMQAVWQGTTPAVANLERKNSYVLSVSQDGYRPVETTLESKMNGWLWGNLLLGGLIGIGVDLSTGAWRKLSPNEVNVQLVMVSSLTPTGRDDVLYAVFRARSEDGVLSTSVVPMRPDPAVEAARVP